MRQPITVTPTAVEQIKTLLDKRGKPSLGIRISVKSKGCNGLAYAIEYADDKKPLDETMEIDGLTIFIDQKATLFILGTEMDYVVEQFESGFKFINPNEKGRCGCGKSFHV